MSNPREFLPGRSLVATSGVAAVIEAAPTVTVRVCVNFGVPKHSELELHHLMAKEMGNSAAKCGLMAGSL